MQTYVTLNGYQKRVVCTKFDIYIYITALGRYLYW
jgi:hypothetical protein